MTTPRLPSFSHEVPGASPDFRTELAARLAELAPEAMADGRLDVEKLRELLADDAADASERFGLFWPGKKRALRAAQAPTTATLKPDQANSKEWDTTQNVFIEGDNLEVLKLLQRHYHNKVKLIYIDPPYNTGKDFVYPDNFTEGLNTYLAWTQQVNEEGRKVGSNTEADGRFHSNWLNMMYPRLKLARNLLTDDGVIFISIDDNEVANLRRLCDEIFGEHNFIDTIAIELSTTSGPKTVNAQQGTIVKNTEFIHVYRKSVEFDNIPHTPLLDGIDSYDTHYSIWINDDGTLGSLSEKLLANDIVGEEIRRYGLFDRKQFSLKNMDKLLSLSEEAKSFIETNLEKIARIDRAPVSAEGKSTKVGHWESFEENRRTYLLTTLESGSLQALMPLSLNYRMSDDYKPRFGRTVIRGDLWKGFHQDMGNVAKEGGIAFSNGKKPIRLIKQLIQWANNTKDGFILDFFAGSSTTAHAVMELNAADNKNRRFIMVQLPEPPSDKSEEGTQARKAGFATIADISRKRIQLAGEKIKANSPLTTQTLDTGFRAYKLADTNFAKWRVTSDIAVNALEQHLLELRDSAAEDAQPDDLLTELLLKLGHSLTETITARTIAGLDVREIGENRVLACVDERVKPTLEQLRALVDSKPARLVVLEDAFQGDDELKTNLAQYARSQGIELWTS